MTMTDRGPGLHVDLDAYFDLALNKAATRIGADVERRFERAIRRVPAQPFNARTAGSVIMGSSGTGVIGLSGPSQGKFWYIRSLVVGGVTPTTIAAGRADLFVGASRQVVDASSLSLADWRDVALTLPAVAFYGRGEVTMRHNELAYFALSSATNGQEYVAGITLEEFEEAALPQDWSR
jgi:hypothetical protein